MSEEEFLEYRLRTTGNANWASNLRGFEPSVEEVRQIGEWRLALDEEHPRPGRNDPRAKEKNEDRRAAQKQLENDTRELFGDARFADFERARDGAYREFYDLAEVFDLSENIAINAWDMRRSAINTANQVRGNDELSVAEKRESLRAIQDETRSSLGAILSDEYLQAYEHKTGDWIDSLSRVRN